MMMTTLPATIDPNVELLEQRRKECQEILSKSTPIYEPGRLLFEFLLLLQSCLLLSTFTMERV